MTPAACRHASLLVCSLATLVAIARPAWSVTPISYSGTVPGPNGIQQTATFTGQRDNANVTGSLTVGPMSVRVTATLAVNGAVAGAVASPDGTPLGTFSAQRSSAGNLTISYSVGGYGGTVTTAMPLGLVLSQPQSQ